MNEEDVEDFSIKFKSDLKKLNCFEAEVERSRKVEEANGRLRKYNGELRNALARAQTQNQVIQIPDDGGDSQLFGNESVGEGNQNLKGSDAVVFNSIIVDMVFKKLDVKNVKKCRLICTVWNEIAIGILSRQNGGYGLAVRLEEGQLKGMTVTLGRETIQGLSSIIASAPKQWFSKALLDSRFTRWTEIQSALLDVGYWLRSIEITGWNFLFQDLHKILVDWCPNLEQLALPPCLNVQDREDYPEEEELKEVYRKLVFARPLKLTSLFMQDQLCISIVKASPQLKTLSLNCDSDEYSFQFFKDLLKCSEVTNNLKNLKLRTRFEVWTIKLFNSIQFSTKLKTLTIEAVGDVDMFQADELSHALEKLGGTLEKLVIIDYNGMNFKFVFPGMNNLIELRYITNKDCYRPSDSIEFVTGMPNLKRLYLGDYVYEDFNQEHHIDKLFSNCEKLRRNPQKKLEELYVFGVACSPYPTFTMINTIFPNLTKLVVGIFVHRHSNDWVDLKRYYTGVVDGGISEMPNLKELYMDFRRHGGCAVEGFDYMSVVFNQLNKLSNLNRLTIRDNSNSTTSLAGEKLLEIPNLRHVTLIGLKLDGLAAKELTILLYKHDIQLEIEDTEFKEDFRVHIHEQLTFRHRKLV